MSTPIYLSLGSNVAPERNLKLAYDELLRLLGPLTCSTVYQNAPVGFSGDDFLNLVIGAETTLDPASLTMHLERIHTLAGRERGSERFGPRELDIDVLLYGDMVSQRWKLPRKDLLRYGFAACPMAELAPELIHPVTGQTMKVIWEEMSPDADGLHAVSLAF
ncbi:MAG: 2-amino-4-hydroxy-6-hydroxymethyldihydropteridine diphosphokinase [Woeseiaceae bacterium]